MVVVAKTDIAGATGVLDDLVDGGYDRWVPFCLKRAAANPSSAALRVAGSTGVGSSRCFRNRSNYNLAAVAAGGLKTKRYLIWVHLRGVINVLLLVTVSGHLRAEAAIVVAPWQLWFSIPS